MAQWLGALTACMVAVPALSDVEYTMTVLGQPAGAFATVATGMNDAGVVVGHSYFTQSPDIRGWVWTPSGGFTVLPQPGSASRWRAMDINNSGVIAVDGGGDWGIAYRYFNGAYEPIPQFFPNVANAAFRINEPGDIAGTAGPYIIIPGPRAYVAPHNAPAGIILQDAQGLGINDSGQVAGVINAAAYRWTPGTGIQLLPALPSRPLSHGAAINAAGDVVGHATFSSGSGMIPFLYTTAGGMQPIGGFGAGAAAVDVNDNRAVVGNYDIPGKEPWIWTAARGVRFLETLIDPALPHGLVHATRINNVGQILLEGNNEVQGGLVPVVLTPIPVIGDVNGDGIVNVTDLLAVIGAWGSCPPAPALCPGDFNHDGVINVSDLLTVIGNWS